MSTLDLILYGATGFTGRLVAEHLSRRDGDGLRWGIAGRRKDALAEVAAGLGRPDLPIVVADSSDPSALRDMVASTRVVCTTVGPYARYGEPLVAACAEAGVDYCDLTGEVHWMRRMIDVHQGAAERTGARIVHACGFDSIPSDVGTWFVQKEMQARHGVFARSVAGRMKGARGGASGATIQSGLDLMEAVATDPAAARAVSDSYSLNPPGTDGPPVTSHVLPGWDAGFGAFVAPFVMEVSNAKVVRRTHALLGQPWGSDFTYDEAILTGRGPVGAGLAATVAGGMAVGTFAARVGPVRNLLRRVVPDPGTGPSPSAQERGWWDFRLRGEHPTDPDRAVMAKLHGDRDPGYGSTAKMLGETALALAKGESPVGGGVWTPASALGDALLERLPAHAGVTFEVL